MATPFLDTVRTKGQAMRVANAINDTIAASLTTHKVRHVTDAEIKRRFAICERWFRALRGEKKWGIDRCLDALPRALDAELHGKTWEPDSRSVWVPRDGG